MSNENENDNHNQRTHETPPTERLANEEAPPEPFAIYCYGDPVSDEQLRDVFAVWPKAL
jgi:hypothetical protein